MIEQVLYWVVLVALILLSVAAFRAQANRVRETRVAVQRLGESVESIVRAREQSVKESDTRLSAVEAVVKKLQDRIHGKGELRA